MNPDFLDDLICVGFAACIGAGVFWIVTGSIDIGPGLGIVSCVVGRAVTIYMDHREATQEDDG